MLKPLSFFTVKIFDDSIIILEKAIPVYSRLKSSTTHLSLASRKWTWGPVFDQTNIFSELIKHHLRISQKNLAWNLKKLKTDNDWSVNERKSQGPVIYKSRISLWTTNYLRIFKIFEIFPVWKFKLSRSILNWPKMTIRPTGHTPAAKFSGPIFVGNLNKIENSKFRKGGWQIETLWW